MKSGLFQFEIVSGGGGGGVTSVFGRAGVVVAVGGDYTASQVTNVPAGNIAAVTVQNAVNELDTEKAGLALPNIFTAVQSINLNATALPTPFSATALHIANADGQITRVLLDSFGGGQPNITFRRALGTNAAPTAITSGSALGNVNAMGYQATGYVTGSRASFAFFAAENWTDTANGTRLAWSTTANLSTASTQRWGIENDGSFVYSTGTLTGVSTINAVDYFDNGVNINTIYASLALPNIFTAAQIINADPTFSIPGGLAAGAVLHVAGLDGAVVRCVIDGYGAGSPNFTGRRALGTKAVPTAVTLGSVLCNLSGIGYGATAWSTPRSEVRLSAAENWTDIAQGAKVIFLTTALGGTTQVARWNIENDGSLNYEGGALTGVSTINSLAYYTADNVVIDADRSHSLRAYTVATLPAASGASPMRTFCVTDALAPVVGAAVVGGGAVRVPVYDNGAWTCDAGASTGGGGGTSLGVLFGIRNSNYF